MLFTQSKEEAMQTDPKQQFLDACDGRTTLRQSAIA